ncbi:zinc finger matrin-type protein CG9776-like [Phlebotomus argentipes]|uniref:zinc finger matrin-type protein CG9776-like n=1 Tax=Phlebotomus argentipes TaxID=94469 RepID=UPI002892E46A|nr:zinc finger matrin-type protein CG9776-like [Phlebotomus argentipes]
MSDNKENTGGEDDVIPEDFFDDFSNTEFMAGLDVIDTWDEGEDSKDKRGSRTTKKSGESNKELERASQDRDRKRRHSGEAASRESTRKSPERRRPRETPEHEKRRRYSPSRRRLDVRRPPGGRRSRSRTRSRSRSPRGRKRGAAKKTPFLEELAQKLAEKGHSLTGLQPNPCAFQAQGFYPDPGYQYPMQPQIPGMVMPPYPYHQPLVAYPNLAQFPTPVPPPEYGPALPPQFPAVQLNNVDNVASSSHPVQSPMIPGTNPEPPEPALKTPQQEKYPLGLAQMLEDNYVEVKEKITELSSKDSILLRCKKAIDAMRGDSKASNAFIFVPMTTPKVVADGSPVGKFHHVKFPWSADKCEIDTHFITLSSARTREVAQKLGFNATRIINKLKVQDVTDKMTTGGAQPVQDISISADNCCTTAVQTERFECPRCLERELRTSWDQASQTEPIPAKPTVKDVLPDYDEAVISLLARFGQQQRDILIYFMRLIDRPDYVTPYHINTLTSRLQDLPKNIYNQLRQAAQSAYIVNPSPDVRRF